MSNSPIAKRHGTLLGRVRPKPGKDGKMKLRTFLTTTAMAAMVATGALAVDQSVIATITENLAAEGYTYVKVHNGPHRVSVVAKGPNGDVQLLYDGEGNLLREQQRDQLRAGFNGQGGNGTCDGSGPCAGDGDQDQLRLRDGSGDGAGRGPGDGTGAGGGHRKGQADGTGSGGGNRYGPGDGSGTGEGPADGTGNGPGDGSGSGAGAQTRAGKGGKS
jgi:hypothetical protein